MPIPSAENGPSILRFHIPVMVFIATLTLMGCSPLLPLPATRGARYVTLPAVGLRLHAQYLAPKAPAAKDNVQEPPPVVSANGAPGVVLLPGFSFLGWREGLRQARFFTGAGFGVLLMAVRGAQATGGRDDCGGLQSGDARVGLEWLARQKGLNPARLAVVGFERGGQVALLAGSGKPLAQAIVAVNAPSDIPRWRATTKHPGIPEWIDTQCGSGRAARLRSPARLAETIRVPVLLIHGAKNRRVPPGQSRRMAEALTHHGRPVEILILPEAVHRLTPEESSRVFSRISAFLRAVSP